jgi:hypothetical protein
VAKIDVAIEIGSKKAFASALEWPGWCRGAKTEEGAIQALIDYASRYAVVAARAGLKSPGGGWDFAVVEHLKGDASTDYGVPGRPIAAESEPLKKAELERMCALVQACWDQLDAVAKKAPAELRKGPRGGGRDRDKILDHVIGAEFEAYAPKLGLKLSHPAIDDRRAIKANRQALLDAFRRGAGGEPLRERGWPVRYAARRIAWHALDHAWEIEDRSEPA